MLHLYNMRDPSSSLHPAVLADPQWRIVIVRSVWHGECTQALVTDAIHRLSEAGVPSQNIVTIDASGSLEIPLLIQMAITEKHVDGAIAFGVIVQGDTHHADMIARESSHALMSISLRHSVPVINEILYVDALEDARKRSIGKEGKGALAAETLLHALAETQKLRS